MTLALFLIQANKIMRTLRTKVGGLSADQGRGSVAGLTYDVDTDLAFQMGVVRVKD